MRKATVIQDDPRHRHSDADVLVTCMRRLIPIFLSATTERGLKDAEECEDTAKLRYVKPGGITEADILMSKIYEILCGLLEPTPRPEDQKTVVPN